MVTIKEVDGSMSSRQHIRTHEKETVMYLPHDGTCERNGCTLHAIQYLNLTERKRKHSLMDGVLDTYPAGR